MATTPGTDDFCSPHPVAVVRLCLDVPLLVHVPEARPPSLGVELPVAVEQFRPAASTGEHALVFHIDEVAAEPGLCSGLAEDSVLLVREHLAPLFVVVREVALGFTHAPV